MVGKLSRGDAVLIYDRVGEWELISESLNSPHWVSSKYLCSNENCFKKQLTSVSTQIAPPKNYQINKNTQSTFGACPCGSGQFCYGPRGGRFCYTSGGNKSYR